ncbi:MAG: hypothetical protein PHP71_00775 [Methanosarcina sp.]|nr:hypothetical protein [Methanosarcina sp.]
MIYQIILGDALFRKCIPFGMRMVKLVYPSRRAVSSVLQQMDGS